MCDPARPVCWVRKLSKQAADRARRIGDFCEVHRSAAELVHPCAQDRGSAGRRERRDQDGVMITMRVGLQCFFQRGKCSPGSPQLILQLTRSAYRKDHHRLSVRQVPIVAGFGKLNHEEPPDQQAEILAGRLLETLMQPSGRRNPSFRSLPLRKADLRSRLGSSLSLKRHLLMSHLSLPWTPSAHQAGIGRSVEPSPHLHSGLENHRGSIRSSGTSPVKPGYPSQRCRTRPSGACRGRSNGRSAWCGPCREGAGSWRANRACGPCFRRHSSRIRR